MCCEVRLVKAHTRVFTKPKPREFETRRCACGVAIKSNPRNWPVGSFSSLALVTPPRGAPRDIVIPSHLRVTRREISDVHTGARDEIWRPWDSQDVVLPAERDRSHG